MREVVHARSIKFLRVQNDRLPSGRILCDSEIFFSYDRFTGYMKSNQNQFGRALPFAFALTCYKIYLLYSSLSDFDSFRWRVHLSDGVCRLRARVQLKTLWSLLNVFLMYFEHLSMRRSIKLGLSASKWRFCWSEKEPISVVCVSLVSLANLLPPW